MTKLARFALSLAMSFASWSWPLNSSWTAVHRWHYVFLALLDRHNEICKKKKDCLQNWQAPIENFIVLRDWAVNICGRASNQSDE